MKKFIGFFILLIIMMCSCSFAAVDVPEYIRVGLYSGTRAVSSFTVSSESGMQIGLVNEEGDFELIEEVKKNKEVIIKRGSSSDSVFIDGIGEIGDDENYVRIIPNDTKEVPLICVSALNHRGEEEIYNYRGEIEVRRFSTSDMTVINIVSMQDYLYGVVPREIGGNSPIEAVKAQAIIARTYAAKNYDKRSNWDFNLTNTTDDQAYGGYDWENPNSNNAVDETDGMVATYDGELIGGYYFSTSGGYTESSENVWGGEVSYLEAVPDPYEPENLAKTTWTVTYSAEEVEEMLAKRGIDIGDVTNMIVNEYSDAGRVLELEIIGTEDTYVLNKSTARTYLGLNSQWFTINDEEPVIPEYTIYKDYKEIKSDKEDLDDEEKEDKKEKEIKPLLSKVLSTITSIKNNEEENTDNKADEKSKDATKINIDYNAAKKKNVVDTFEIKGRGWGHSVGMSQNGAIGMANNDFSCEEIIKWYYKGVEIEY